MAKPKVPFPGSWKHCFMQLKVARYFWNLSATGKLVQSSRNRSWIGSFLANAVDDPETPKDKVGIACHDMLLQTDAVLTN